MDSEQFDRVAKTLAQTGTRRGVVRLLAALQGAGFVQSARVTIGASLLARKPT